MAGILALIVLALVAVPGVASAPPKRQPFSLTGTVVSVQGATLVIKVLKGPRALRRYEQKGELTVTLASAAVIRMGKKRIAAAALKPQERVSVSGWYTPGPRPTLQATSLTVVSAR